MVIKVDFDYDADYMYCPDSVNMDMETLCKRFMNWIYDERMNHPFWIDENKKAVCFRAEAIAYWLNENVLSKEAETAVVLEKMVKEDKASDYTIVL